jgi:hypothetical protein
MWNLLFPPELWAPLEDIIDSVTRTTIFFMIVLGTVYLIALYGELSHWNPQTMFWGIVITYIVVAIIIIAVASMFSPFKLFGVEVFNSAPNTCVGQKGSLEGGLCYNNCRQNFHGLGVRCYADSVGIGPGTVVGLEPCRDGYRTEGLVCSNVGWDSCKYNTVIGCIGGFTGDFYGRLNNGGVCPGPQDFGGNFDDEYKKWKRSNDKPDPVIDPHTQKMETAAQANTAGHKTCDDIATVGNDKHTEKIDGLCYKKCPADYPHHIPGLPYLCYKGGDLSYDRGGGDIPAMFSFFQKYTWP